VFLGSRSKTVYFKLNISTWQLQSWSFFHQLKGLTPRVQGRLPLKSSCWTNASAISSSITWRILLSLTSSSCPSLTLKFPIAIQPCNYQIIKITIVTIKYCILHFILYGGGKTYGMNVWKWMEFWLSKAWTLNLLLNSVSSKSENPT